VGAVVSASATSGTFLGQPIAVAPTSSVAATGGGTLTQHSIVAVTPAAFGAAAQDAYKAQLAAAAGGGVTAADITLTVQGSASPLLVSSTIVTPTVALATSAGTGVSTAVASSATSGTFLGVAVTAVPPVVSVASVIPAPSPPPPLAPWGSSALIPYCFCDNFRNDLTSVEYGTEACAREEVHGLTGYKTWCAKAVRPFIPFLDSGCPSDTYRCTVVPRPELVFPVCQCDKYANGLAINTAIDGACQKNAAHGERICYPRNYAGDKKIGGSEFYGCPEDTFRCS